MSLSQFLLTDHTWTGSCAFAHVVLLNSVVYIKTKGPSRPFGLFLLRGISYPRQCLGCQSELFVVCIYVFCLINGHRLPCCPLCYLLPCRVYIRPIRKTLMFCYPFVLHPVKSNKTGWAQCGISMFHNYLFGGPGGIRTPVQNTFLSASYSNNYYLLVRIT
jgi:hypothetical protein